jgi:hypothetical protein
MPNDRSFCCQRYSPLAQVPYVELKYSKHSGILSLKQEWNKG